MMGEGQLDINSIKNTYFIGASTWPVGIIQLLSLNPYNA